MNVALIGSRRGAVHARWLSATPGFTVVGIAHDGDERAAAALAAHHPGAQVTADALSLVKREDVDMVVVAVPPAAAEDVLALALRRGVRVVSEMPLAADRDTALRLTELAAAGGARACASFQWRCNEALGQARSWVLGGDVGELLAVDVTLYDDSHLGPGTRWPWRQRAGSGGALLELGTHAFDLVRWATAVPVWDVCSAWTHRVSDTRRGPRGPVRVEVDDVAQVEMRAFGRDTRARVMVSRVGPEHRLVAVFTGSKGVLEVRADGTDGSGVVTLRTGSRSVRRVTGPDGMNPYPRLAADTALGAVATFDDALAALTSAHAALAVAAPAKGF
ncbi:MULTISPECIES: Gfo/Idh/MocA family protein [unclassified Streptomyces]|uniref:Gfo/Idh/MocA family protein n=1 Tax=unclassified Streptomyces TaxID=2593676 RepID=UPI0036FF78B1